VDSKERVVVAGCLASLLGFLGLAPLVWIFPMSEAFNLCLAAFVVSGFVLLSWALATGIAKDLLGEKWHLVGIDDPDDPMEVYLRNAGCLVCLLGILVLSPLVWRISEAGAPDGSLGMFILFGLFFFFFALGFVLFAWAAITEDPFGGE